MKEEIKEMFDIFTKYKDDWYSCEYKLKPKQCVTLYDYITNLRDTLKDREEYCYGLETQLTNLQEENKRLKENTYLMIGKTKYIFELLDKINKAKEIYENRNSIKYKKKRFMEDKNTSDLMYEVLKGDKDE